MSGNANNNHPRASPPSPAPAPARGGQPTRRAPAEATLGASVPPGAIQMSARIRGSAAAPPARTGSGRVPWLTRSCPMSSFSTLTRRSRRASATPARAALVLASSARAGVCRVVAQHPGCRGAGGPRSSPVRCAPRLPGAPFVAMNQDRARRGGRDPPVRPHVLMPAPLPLAILGRWRMWAPASAVRGACLLLISASGGTDACQDRRQTIATGAAAPRS